MSETKVIQIAVATAFDDGGEERERLYALDSDGHIWMWVNETAMHTAGWSSVDSPIEGQRQLKPDAKPLP